MYKKDCQLLDDGPVCLNPQKMNKNVKVEDLKAEAVTQRCSVKVFLKI